MAKMTIPITVWFPCSEILPNVEAETPFLVTCREWDIFENMWGRKEVRIISYSPKAKSWNTKSDIKVEAWLPLPEVYNS